MIKGDMPMFYRLNSEEVAMLRTKYPVGASVVVYSMNDPRPVAQLVSART